MLELDFLLLNALFAVHFAIFQSEIAKCENVMVLA